MIQQTIRSGYRTSPIEYKKIQQGGRYMLYHLSTDLNNHINEFKPRVPKRENRMKGENNYIPRICVAKSIEDCLSAMPEGGYALGKSDKPNIIRVYEFNEADVIKENLIAPSNLYFEELVLDAWVTGEYWIVEQNIKPVRIYDIELKEIQVTDAPFVHPEQFKKAYLKTEDPSQILDELEEKANESVARIINLDYRLV